MVVNKLNTEIFKYIPTILNKDLYNIGLDVGKFYTDKGLPIDIALSRLDFTKDQKVSILHGALHWLIIHKRNSGATEASIDRQRASNLNTMDAFIKTGETGIY